MLLDCVEKCIERYVEVLKRFGKRVTKKRLSIIRSLCLIDCS